MTAWEASRSQLAPPCPEGTLLTAEAVEDGQWVVHWFWDDGRADRTVCGEPAPLSVYLEVSTEVLDVLHRPASAGTRAGPVLCPVCRPMVRALHTHRDHPATPAYRCGNGCTATVPDVGDTTNGPCPCSTSGTHMWVSSRDSAMLTGPGGDLDVGLVRIVYLGGRTADLRLPAALPGDEARRIAGNVSAYRNVARVTAVCASYTPGKVSVWRYAAGDHVPPVDVIATGRADTPHQGFSVDPSLGTRPAGNAQT
ncbi:MAG: hypothetical protein QOJ50_3189 [Cryptosporangiaceae bacterium]|jgi:hypothetical protein|nr:hypothetical protein [Cryptosporangiaceae bacterium]